MFVITAFLLASVYHGTQAISVFRRAVPPTCPLRRSLFAIVWNCWSTIFICAWVSVHPNIPPPTERGTKALGRRAVLMFWAVVAPEVILAWAVRQWFAANKILEIYNAANKIKPLSKGFCADLWEWIKCWFMGCPVETNEAWTKTHGHFLGMGGFIIGNDRTSGCPRHPEKTGDSLFAKNEVISFETFKHLINQDDFKVSITEDEIADKSKSDSLSKLIAILQTSKFIVQCIVRWRQDLALTALELVTLALASLNAITYVFWWAKPYDVKVQATVYLQCNCRPQNSEQPSITMFSSSTQFRKDSREFFCALLIKIRDIFRSPCKDFLFRWLFMFPIYLAFLLFFPIYFLIVSIFASLNDIVDTVNVVPKAAYVPMFYAPRTKEEASFRFVIFAIFGLLFGGLHCIGWHFEYPTLLERTLWRTASLTITSIPFVTMLIMLISLMVSESERTQRETSIQSIVRVVIGSATAFGSLQFFLYVLARLILLGQAAALLRSLQTKALEDIDWLKLFPSVASSDSG